MRGEHRVRVSQCGDANDRGYVERHHVPGHGQYVSVSVAGHEHLRKCRGQQLTDLESVVI
jgi:hypothetical protein